MTLQECNHHELVEFDADKARAMTAQEVRKAYPRKFVSCIHCGFHGIVYASWEHYIAGDW